MPDARIARDAARSIPGGLHVELAGRVGIQQIVLQHTAFDHGSAARGHTFVVERRRSEEPWNGAIVNEGDSLVRDFLAQFPREERRLAINRPAVDRFENIAQQAAGNPRFKDHGHALRFHFHRA